MRAALTLALGLLTAPTLVQAHGEADQEEQRLPTIGAAPEFALTSQNGAEVTLGSFRGKVVAVTFIYTACPDVCPLLSDKMARVQDALGPDFGTQVAFLSITVDPQHDTPEVLKEYAEALDADPRGWTFLTGTPAAVREVAQRYGVAVAPAAFLILLGAVGLRVLSGMNERTEELIELQRKITAYRHVQHDTTRQLYGVSSALLSPDERVLHGILRQLSQFSCDLDRLQYVAQDEVALLAEVRQDYDRFIGIVTRAVELARAGQITEARQVQLSEAGPLADRLERLTNQLVNVAEADMLERIEASERAYDVSRLVVVAFALGSIILALGLGYVFSWSIVGPLTRIGAQLRKIAGGAFAERIDVANRDELGALAADVNRTSEELGSLYHEIEERARELSEQRDRAGHHLRRPGRDRDRERAPVRRGPGAHARAD